jgi:hypothetical protein
MFTCKIFGVCLAVTYIEINVAKKRPKLKFEIRTATIMTEALRSSETFGSIYQTVRFYVPEDRLFENTR